MTLGGKQIVFGVVGVALLSWASIRVMNWSTRQSGRVEYPYWCQMGHVFSVNALKDAGWPIHPEGSSDSVVVCLEEGCQEKAYPAAQCGRCGTYHLLHIWPNSRCPVCHPQVAQAAEEQGIDLTPPELPNR